MIKGWTRNQYSSMKSVSMSELTSVALPSIWICWPGCYFNLVISSTTFSLIIVELFQSALFRVVETTYLGRCSICPRLRPHYSSIWTGKAQAFHMSSGPGEVHQKSGFPLECIPVYLYCYREDTIVRIYLDPRQKHHRVTSTLKQLFFSD